MLFSTGDLVLMQLILIFIHHDSIREYWEVASMYLSHDNSFNNEWHVWTEVTSEYDIFFDVTYNVDDFFNFSEEERIFYYFLKNLSIIELS